MDLFILIFFGFMVVDRMYSSFAYDKFSFKYYRYEFVSDLFYILFWVIDGFLTSFNSVVILALFLFVILAVYHLTMAIKKRKNAPKITA